MNTAGVPCADGAIRLPTAPNLLKPCSAMPGALLQNCIKPACSAPPTARQLPSRETSSFSIWATLQERTISEPARLSPHDPITSFVAGQLEASTGHDDIALADFQRALALDSSLTHEALSFLSDISRSNLASKLVWNDPRSLLHLAETLEGRSTSKETSIRCRDRAFQLLRDAAQQQMHAEDWATLGELYQQHGNYPAAADCYSCALADDYTQWSWHLKRAQCLESAGRRDEASREARACLRLHPGLLEAEQLIDRIRADSTTQPATAHASPGL